MKSADIKILSEKNFSLDDINEIKNNYEISYGSYENFELQKAIKNETPFFIKKHFVVGYDPATNKFMNDRQEEFVIERLVKAIIVEDVKEPEPEEPEGDHFAIIGKMVWVDPITEFKSILGGLKVGEIYLPPHSVVFNFLDPTPETIKEKIPSDLVGININIYERDDYIGNSFHEIGHVYWRSVLSHDEKESFNKHQELLPLSSIYEYKWERSTGEEVFCTLYKFLLKSFLLNPSFYNILEHEDKSGCDLLKAVLDRVRKDRIIEDVWKLNEKDLFDYINPKGKVVKTKGTFDKIKDTEIPNNMLNDVDSFRDGIMYVNLNKAVIPVKGNLIDWEEMEKARFTKYSDKKPDGKGGWIYKYPEDSKKKVKK